MPNIIRYFSSATAAHTDIATICIRSFSVFTTRSLLLSLSTRYVVRFSHCVSRVFPNSYQRTMTPRRNRFFLSLFAFAQWRAQLCLWKSYDVFFSSWMLNESEHWMGFWGFLTLVISYHAHVMIVDLEWRAFLGNHGMLNAKFSVSHLFHQPNTHSNSEN